MPNPLSISISNTNPHPNGSAAVLSKTNANGNPNQATWTASDKQYSIALPANVWSPPSGGSLSFTLAQNTTSGVYTLKSNSPTGEQSYTITATTAGGLPGDVPPKVVVEP